MATSHVFIVVGRGGTGRFRRTQVLGGVGLANVHVHGLVALLGLADALLGRVEQQLDAVD